MPSPLTFKFRVYFRDGYKVDIEAFSPEAARVIAQRRVPHTLISKIKRVHQ